ncbi:hypothetical protein [Micromonospora sp. NPDC005299]|uniref:hypothetical protein n=1 Tax=Micromonospora sp. NPDC005299 TaxID=3364231 RepID=UPI00369A972D
MNDLVAQLRLPRRACYAGIRDSQSPNLNNVTTTKQAVTSATGMIVIASNDDTHRYWHADLSWGSSWARARVGAGARLLAPRS